MYRIRRFPCFVAILIGISCSVSIGCDLPPIAVITSPSGIATWVRAGTSLQFDGCSSWDDGQIVDFNWTWCDNTPSGTTCSANHSYSESAKHYFPELQVTDDGGQSDCACTSIWTASMGFATSSSYPYIPVNDDDDNANGIMDCWETGSVANENDLVGFGLSVTSSSSSRDKVELSVTSTAALQVWDEDSRTGLLITSGDSSEYWTASGITNWVHAEAKNPSAGSKLNDPYLQWRFYGQYSQQYPLYGWNDADESSKRCICVHVDMDLAGVVDDSYSSTITQEITPGGFIQRGTFVNLIVRPVQPSSISPSNPTNWSQLTLSASSSKVRIWDSTKNQNYGQSHTFSPTQDTIFCIEGYQASTYPCDIELTLTHGVTGFQDKIKVTVYTFDFENVSSTPANRHRTTIGVGEKVRCFVVPSCLPSIEWTTNRGTLSPTSGWETEFTAIKEASSAVVCAHVPGKPEGECGFFEFTMIPPTGEVNSFVRQDLGGFVSGPPNLFLGTLDLFAAQVLPATVSFRELQFRENIPVNTWTWPNGPVVSYGPAQLEFKVYDDNIWGDNNGLYGAPVEWLGGQNFEIPVSCPEQWQDEWGDWHTFLPSGLHVFWFNGSTLQTRGNIYDDNVPDPGGPWEGPWLSVP